MRSLARNDVATMVILTVFTMVVPVSEAVVEVSSVGSNPVGSYVNTSSNQSSSGGATTKPSGPTQATGGGAASKSPGPVESLSSGGESSKSTLPGASLSGSGNNSNATQGDSPTGGLTSDPGSLQQSKASEETSPRTISSVLNQVLDSISAAASNPFRSGTGSLLEKTLFSPVRFEWFTPAFQFNSPQQTPVEFMGRATQPGSLYSQQLFVPNQASPTLTPNASNDKLGQGGIKTQQEVRGFAPNTVKNNSEEGRLDSNNGQKNTPNLWDLILMQRVIYGWGWEPASSEELQQLDNNTGPVVRTGAYFGNDELPFEDKFYAEKNRIQLYSSPEYASNKDDLWNINSLRGYDLVKNLTNGSSVDLEEPGSPQTEPAFGPSSSSGLLNTLSERIGEGLGRALRTFGL